MFDKADFLVDISFMTSEEGGRSIPSLVKDIDYTYRPTFFLEGNRDVAYSCGMVIENTREVIKPHMIIKDVPILLLHPEDVMQKIKVDALIEFTEGDRIVASGVITKLFKHK